MRPAGDGNMDWMKNIKTCYKNGGMNELHTIDKTQNKKGLL